MSEKTKKKSSTVTKTFGGTGGGEFSKESVNKIRLRGGSWVDQIQINGVNHGGNTGFPTNTMHIGDGEYIRKVVINDNDLIRHASFTTNKGVNINSGGEKPSPEHVLEGIRVLRIGGRAGAFLDGLDIEYIEDYTPSTVEEKHAGFILGFTSPFQKYVEFESSREKTIDSYEKITNSMLSQKYSANVEGEYYVKVTASTEIQFQNTELTTIKNELEKELNKSSQRSIEIPAGHVGIFLLNGTIMKGSDSEFWMFPTSELSHTVIKIDEFKNLLGHYDLTGELFTQMPGLKPFKIDKNGYVYYKETSQ